eukprot:CAMPEP_0183725170 /NCGR_PEP_ID=MMETSP0737-20130205/19665_1 /TAXON_ID=385413 /ORGANISM="Thalassiosira miniscula, Strain CCMP1093" /LENGTH=177 /DNA_ID=CAMNT_0025956017 /DNA_START=166 /DNA_END=699 /DNA_ORIENTATION=+
MSSDAAPGETPADDASSDLGHGGSSVPLTQGEIIFVTIMSFVVVLAIALGAYAVCRHRRKKQMPEKEEIKRRASEGQGTDILVDLEGSGSMDQEGGDIPLVKFQDIRRASADSNGNDTKSNRERRATIESEGSNRLSSSGRAPRRPSQCTIGTNVSMNYKAAAIEHMNAITQTGRHD